MSDRFAFWLIVTSAVLFPVAVAAGRALYWVHFVY